MTIKDSLRKFTANKPLFYGTLAVGGIGGILYLRHRAASKPPVASASGTGQETDSAGNVGVIDPATGFVYGSAEDQQALAQEQAGLPGALGVPGGSGTFTSTGGATGNSIQTNEEWVREAERNLPHGHSVHVENALLKVLAGQRVTADQRSIFLEAVGVTGEPPAGYPKPIRLIDTPGHPHKPPKHGVTDKKPT